MSANVQSLQLSRQESSSVSDVPLTGTPSVDALGQQLTNVVREAWLRPYSTKSNFAKYEADWIAAAASLGLLTTRVSPNRVGRTWRVTPRGLSLLFPEENQ